MTDTDHFIDGVNDDRPCYCCNCGWEGPAKETQPIQNLTQRIDAGELVPIGECPECGALAQLEQGDYSDRFHPRATHHYRLDYEVHFREATFPTSISMMVCAGTADEAKAEAERLLRDKYAQQRVEIVRVTKLVVRNMRDLSREALVEIAEYARGGLYLDIGLLGEFYNLDKDVSGADFIEHMTNVLGKHDLIPREETS
jgi:hypothetical protein